LKGPAKTVDELDREVARHGLHLSAALVRLAWAVRALHGNGGAVDRIDGSFIDDEVMGEDTAQPDAERKLPGGIGTLVFAGRLVLADRHGRNPQAGEAASGEPLPEGGFSPARAGCAVRLAPEPATK